MFLRASTHWNSNGRPKTLELKIPAGPDYAFYEDKTFFQKSLEKHDESFFFFQMWNIKKSLLLVI